MKNKYIDITREDWISLISLDKNNPINKKLGAKFICQEEIKKTEETILCGRWLYMEKDFTPTIA